MKKMIHHFWDWFDELVLKVKQLFSSKFMYYFVLLLNFMAVAAALPKTVSNATESNYFAIATLTVLAFFSALFAWIAQFSAEKRIWRPGEKIAAEPGFMFISLAVYCWVVTNLSQIYFQPPPLPVLTEWVEIVLSDFNTLFFLYVIPFIDYKDNTKPWLIMRMGRFWDRRALFLLGLTLLIYYSILTFVIWENPAYAKHIVYVTNIISVCITIPAFIIFVYAFYKVFEERYRSGLYIFIFSSLLLGVTVTVTFLKTTGLLANSTPQIDMLIKAIFFSYRPVILSVFIIFTISGIYETFKSYFSLVSKTHIQFNKILVGVVNGDIIKKELLLLVKSEIEKMGLFEYFIGVALKKESREDENHSQIVFLFFEKNYNYEVAEYYSNALEGTFASYCINTGEIVAVNNIHDRRQMAKYNVALVTSYPGHKSRSLIYIPIKKQELDKTKTIGALTIQFEEENRVQQITKEQLYLLRALADLLGSVNFPFDVPPEIKFIRDVQRKRNDPYHQFFQNAGEGFLKEDKLTEMDWLYEEMKSLFKIDQVTLEQRFCLSHNNSLHGGHPLNRIMKGITQKQVSCGLILLLAAYSYERMILYNKKAYSIEEEPNAILKAWQNYAPYKESRIECLSRWNPYMNQENANKLNIFYREAAEPNESVQYFEEKISAIYELLEELVVARATGQPNFKDMEIHWTDGKPKLKLTFGIEDPKSLKEKIEANIGKVHLGVNAMTHSLAKKIVALLCYRMPGSFQYTINEDIANSSITLLFTQPFFV